MTNNNLTHHEQLRYRYLLSNLRFLNDHEKQEFDYLRWKMESGQSYASPVQEDDLSYEQLESYQPDETYFEGFDNDDSAQYTAQGLPIFPNDRPVKSRSAKRSGSLRSDRLNSYQEVPVYSEPVIEETVTPVKPKKVKKPKKPRKKGRVKRFFQVLGVLLLLVFAGMIYMFYKGASDVSSGKTDYSPAVTEKFNGAKTSNGTNILILGSDKRITQGSADARTDTIMVMNIGNKEGKIKLVSFMRDTLVNIPGASYSDSSYDQKLNVAFNLGEQDHNQGAELMRQTLKNNFDLDIKYYVMVDFQTFAEAVDTLFPKGVEINAKFHTINGEKVSSVEAPNDIGFGDQSTPYQTIKVGKQRMNGQTLLNYARFRSDDTADYGRTERQQQVISALISQIKDPTKLFTGSAAIGKIYALTSTNVSYPFLIKEGLAAMTGGKGIEHITIPEQGDWVDEYDMYGGLGISIDFDKYQGKLADLGLR